jgi:hypothetical protein
MARIFPIMDARKVDGRVAAEPAKRQGAAVHLVSPTGARTRSERLIRSTDATSYEALVERFGSPEGVAKALTEGDPEIPLGLVGSRLGNDASPVFVDPDGNVLAVAHFLEVVVGPDGEERSRKEFLDVEATVTEEGAPMVWTGRLMAKEDIIRKMAFTRVYQLRHIDGLTYEFLFNMAKTLADAGKMLFVGTGEKGAKPLIFSTNGSPYRGFLEGRVDGTAYRLVLHLTNLEIKHVGEVPS